MLRFRSRFRLFSLVGLSLLAGCQAISGGEGIATIDADLTMYASESRSIRAAATAERSMVVETLAAAGTRVSELSAVNAALGATLRANYTGTPEVRAVVVSAEDMGGSLEDDMMDDEPAQTVPEPEMRVSNLSTAQSTDPDSGCSAGTVTEFSPDSERVYVTARVASLRSGTLFEADWQFDGRTIYRVDWLSDFSRSFVCIWFFATPVDFPFLPGNYSATLYVDGEATGSTEFTIANS